MGADFEQEPRIPQSTLLQLRGILISSLSRENLGALDQPEPAIRRRKVRFQDAGAAPVDANQRQSRPASANKGAHLSLQLETTTADNGTGEPGSREGGATSAQGRERDDRARLVRERNQGERQRKLEELRAQALAAQRFREQKEDERRRRIDEMRHRDNDRRTQVEERKRAIWEAERERREAILRRNSERDARLEVRKRGGTPAAAVFAFGSSTPRMLEPADTGGTFWGHRRATSTSNVMFAALPLSRRSSERELDPNKKRATSASGLDRQPGDEDGNAGDSSSWSRGVARRRTDLVPTLPAGHRIASAAIGTPRSPGRAYSMTRLDQLARPRKIIPFTMPAVQPSAPSRPPRHRSAGNLAGMSKAHRSMGNLTQGATLSGHNAPSPPPRKHSRPPHAASAAASHQLNAAAVSGLRSGEVTPGSPSRPGSSLSSASVNNSAMTSSVAGALSVNRRPRATPRRPRPASIAGTGVTTPPHVKNMGVDGKPIGVRAEKPPLPRVHSAATGAKKGAQPPTPTSDKPEVPRRTHKAGSVKASPRVTPRATPLQSPGNDFPPYNLEEILETTTVQTIKEGGEVTETQTVVSQTQQVVSETSTSESSSGQDVITSTLVTETVKQVTKDDDGEKETETKTVTTSSMINDGPQQVSTVVTETVTVSDDDSATSKKLVESSEKMIEKNEPKDTNGSSSEPVIIKAMKNMKMKEETVEVNVKEESKVPDVLQAATDPLEGADMTGSMMARSRGMITTEEGAKAALAERRKFAREEAERQAEKERLRLEREAEEEVERQRQEDERQRRLEEETLRLSELQRQAEEERLQQAILEAQRRTEEENQRREAEVRAKAERDIAEARAREEAERQRRDTAQRLRREEEEREARRKRVEAIMLRTRQAKQKKDGDKSPTEENKSLEDVEQKLEAKLNEEETRQLAEGSDGVDIESSYELSVRQREEDLLNHTAPHNQAVTALPQSQPPQSFSPKPAEVEMVTGNGLNPFQNGTPVASNGDLPKKEDTELSQSNNSYAVQNGHSKNQINELNNFINSSENQFNSVALDNAVKQNNVTNNLLDISDLDILNTANSNNPFLIDVNTNGGSQMQQSDGNNTNQIIDLSVDTITKSIINEDSVNSNQTNNSPFITSFQDNQENRDVSLL